MSRDDAALAALRIDALRLRLQWQRAAIADRLGDAPRDRAFPRSATLRWVLRHPALVVGFLLPRARPMAAVARLAVAAGVAGVLLLVGSDESDR